MSLSGDLRQETDDPPIPTPQDKAIGDSFPIAKNSKIRRAGQLREKAGPSPDHIFLVLEVRRPPWPHMRRKAPGRPKGSYGKERSTQKPDQ